MLGIGGKGGLREPYATLAQLAANSGAITVAVDLPSGLDCDTGEPLGPCVKAAHTATFVAPKKGLLNPAAADWAGTVHVVGIGAPRKLVEDYQRR